ncbi:MAG: polyphosphate kinase 1 [Cyclobacteriaceae bacterium]
MDHTEEVTADIQEAKVDSKYFDRDLSWLKFNERVLMESEDERVPILERLRFLAIYSSNLDEFFRVRVADIRSLAHIDKKKLNKEAGIRPKKLLKMIHEGVMGQLGRYGASVQSVIQKLDSAGLKLYLGEPIPEEDQEPLLYYFKTKVLGYLQPYIFGVNENPPFLNNRELYLAVKLRLNQSDDIHYAYVNIPSDKLPRFVKLSSKGNTHHFGFLDDVVISHLDVIFPNAEVLEAVNIKLNKDADLQIDDEFDGDLVKKIENQISKRNLGIPSRFLFDRKASKELVAHFKEAFQLSDTDLVSGGQYHNSHDFWQLPNVIGASLENDPLVPVRHSVLDQHRFIFSAIDAGDQMLHFPYHSYDYILQFFNEAAIDPDVKTIRVTFYRMASNSFIGDALISAAKNGKEVLVFMELKARFDEANNLRWAAKMKEAGVKIVYSIPGLKVHAKVALVTKKTTDGEKRYGFLGTGNLNEKTAEIYADHGLLTCHKEITSELKRVFLYLSEKEDPGQFDHLLVSQFNIVERFTELIDREIANAKKGFPASIIIKINNLEERGIIDKLYEASEAGVKIDLLVRSICCLLPGQPYSANINVIRIVDRYLEHARVFVFHNDGSPEVFMGSADWMKRNLYRRVEVTFPVYDGELRAEIMKILDLQLRDNCKAVTLDAEHNNLPVQRKDEEILVRAQTDTYSWIRRKEEN